MLARMQDVLRLILSQALPSPLTELSKLGNANLTQSSWAKLIRSYADVPQIYQNFFDPLLSQGKTFPYTILIPSYERYSRRQAEKLICDFGSEIYILEKCEDTFKMECFPITGISYIEFSTALLVSSIKICGLSSQEVYVSSMFTFNSVTDCLFMPVLKHMRLFANVPQNIARSLEVAKSDHLGTVNYKFSNFAKHSLLEGETVIYSIFQPEIQEEILKLFGQSLYRTIAPTHMTILTDRELILIREDATRRREDRYGGLWDYIPLHKIVSLSVSEKSHDLLVLAIQLPENTYIECPYQASAKNEIDRLLNLFRMRTPAL